MNMITFWLKKIVTQENLVSLISVVVSKSSAWCWIFNICTHFTKQNNKTCQLIDSDFLKAEVTYIPMYTYIYTHIHVHIYHIHIHTYIYSLFGFFFHFFTVMLQVTAFCFASLKTELCGFPLPWFLPSKFCHPVRHIHAMLSRVQKQREPDSETSQWCGNEAHCSPFLCQMHGDLVNNGPFQFCGRNFL